MGNALFRLLCVEGEDGIGGRLRAGAAGGGDAGNGEIGQNGGIVEDLPALGEVLCKQRDGFCRVHSAAAADADEEIHLFRCGELLGREHRLHRGVFFDLVEEYIRGAAQSLQNVCKSAGFYGGGLAGDDHGFRAQAAKFRAVINNAVSLAVYLGRHIKLHKFSSR